MLLRSCIGVVVHMGMLSSFLKAAQAVRRAVILASLGLVPCVGVLPTSPRHSRRHRVFYSGVPCGMWQWRRRGICGADKLRRDVCSYIYAYCPAVLCAAHSSERARRGRGGGAGVSCGHGQGRAGRAASLEVPRASCCVLHSLLVSCACATAAWRACVLRRPGASASVR